MTAKTPAPPTGPELERKLIDEMERGRRLGSLADGERRRAELAFQAAEADRKRAVQAEIKGDADAPELLTKALRAAREAANAVSEAQDRADAGREVHAQAEARLFQVRETLLDELAPSAEELTQAALAAQAALVEPLRAFEQAYSAAVARWRQLVPGTRAKVWALDAERGEFRSEDRVMREALAPSLPVEPELLEKLLTVVPRPLCMNPDYVPGRPPEEYTGASENAGPEFIFDGHPEHQRHAYPPTEQDPSQVVMANARHGAPPTREELNQRTLQRFKAEFDKSVGE